MLIKNIIDTIMINSSNIHMRQWAVSESISKYQQAENSLTYFKLIVTSLVVSKDSYYTLIS